MDKLARIRRQAVSTDDTIPAVSSPRAQRRQRWLPALITAAQQRLFGQDDAATPRHRASTPLRLDALLDEADLLIDYAIGKKPRRR